MPPTGFKHQFNHHGRVANKLPRGTKLGSFDWEFKVVTTRPTTHEGIASSKLYDKLPV